MNNEVVIIGGNHHNTLAVVRSFGKKRIECKILIHEDEKKIEEMMISYSKYTKNLFITNNNEMEIIQWLLDNKKDYKQIIIPCSDLAEYTIDKNYSKLINYYYIPGFKNNPGLVCKMMDKYNQKKWADNNSIPMANSWLINISEQITLPDNIIYPCIAKPNVSAQGAKSDIKICENKKELLKCLKDHYSKYNDVIIQQYLNKKFELLAMGYISDNGIEAGGVERKIRETIPGGGGSTALGQFTDEKDIIDFTNNILNKLYQEGYRGLYDIELFECSDGLYLNEINFRHSGSGFALINNGINAPYLYYLDCKNKEHESSYKLRHKHGYFLCDIGELNLLLKYKTINIFQFIFDFFKSYTHSIFSLNDLNVIKFYISRGKK